MARAETCRGAGEMDESLSALLSKTLGLYTRSMGPPKSLKQFCDVIKLVFQKVTEEVNLREDTTGGHSTEDCHRNLGERSG